MIKKCDNIKKKVLIYIVIFLGTLTVCMSFLFFSSCIPNKYINYQLSESVLSMIDNGGGYPPLIANNDSTLIDQFADYMSIKLLHYIDSHHPIISSLEVNTYLSSADISYGSLEAINGLVSPNFSYWRYWHGNLGVLRVLFVFFNRSEINVLMSIVLGFLFLLLIYLLCKKKCYLFSCFIVIAFLCSYGFVVPFCFEYFWTFFLGFLFAVFSALCYKKNNFFIYGMFIVMGVLCNFLDFLSTELVPPLFSLLIILYLRRKNMNVLNFKEQLKFIVICFFLWLGAYAFTWIVKWLISSIFFHESLVDLFYDHILERISGFETFKKVEHPFLATLAANIAGLFPFQYLPNYWSLIVFVIFVALIFIIKIIRKEFTCYSIIYFILFLVPYLRFTVLMGHSFVHSFFTYRVQFISIICLFLIIVEGKKKKSINN